MTAPKPDPRPPLDLQNVFHQVQLIQYQLKKQREEKNKSA
jgi:hypothetical protein